MNVDTVSLWISVYCITFIIPQVSCANQNTLQLQLKLPAFQASRHTNRKVQTADTKSSSSPAGILSKYSSIHTETTHTHTHTSFNTKRRRRRGIKMTNTNNNDDNDFGEEHGDDDDYSFLDNFDVEAAIAQRNENVASHQGLEERVTQSSVRNPYKQKRTQNNPTPTHTPTHTSTNTNNTSNGNRNRNPYAKHQPSQSSSQLFGSSSTTLSMGTKTNPNDFTSFPPPDKKLNRNPYKRSAPTTTATSSSISSTCSSTPTPSKKQHRTPPTTSSSSASGTVSGYNSTSLEPDPESEPDPHPEPIIPIDSKLQTNLIQTLSQYFGHTSFRNGQLDIIHAILNGRDAAVFWSTGSGKSLCYQLPPLYTKKCAIVVSPLISLMEDQVAKLNGLVSSSSSSNTNNGDTHSNNSNSKSKDLAVFLGTGQMDPMAETRALNGDYSLIYITPEKLCSNDGYFLNQLGHMHEQGKFVGDNGGGGGGKGKEICLIAIDESHCVSEWGHDFRKDYRKLGSVLRSSGISTSTISPLDNIPIVALTATAVPRVQNDILTSLKLKHPKIVKQSFDRDNLVLSVQRKPTGGYRTALAPWIKDMKEREQQQRAKARTRRVNHTNSKVLLKKGENHNTYSYTYRHNESTIIYCPTTNIVDEMAAWLSSQFRDSDICVEPYHGKLSNDKRTDAHINFLTGRTSIIVATVAFGMGIDKPDTRRIIHFGPPKTVEEYYQQIGRAGRDGVESYCTMYCNDGDFSRYKNEFYVGDLTGEARANQEASTDALRRFAINDEVCRRAELLKFFHEIPLFGERCGTCDNCVSRAKNADDLERDFAGSGARLVLYAISVLRSDQGIGQIEKVLKGNDIEDYRYKNRYANATAIQRKVMEMKDQLKGYKKRVPVSYFSKDLLPALLSRGYVDTKSVSSVGGGFTRTWSGYFLTHKGQGALESGPIMLPVPASIRDYERQQAEKVRKSLETLKKAGADIDQIPQHELDEGEGTVFRALTTWYNFLERLERRDQSERIDQLEDLRLRIDGWRMDVASKYRISPADAMPDHLLLSIAYTTASASVAGINEDVLLAAGVRSGGIDLLVETLNEWIIETKPQDDDMNDNDNMKGNAMILPDEPFTPAKAWEHFVYRPQKKTGLASWESSYNRFSSGEHPQTIAISPVNGRPIQVATVVGHILDGMLHGRPVNLQRVGTILTPPNKPQWELLASLEVDTGIDVTGDPKTCGIDGGPFRMVDFLSSMMGDEFNSKEYADRTPEEKEKFSKWCNLLKWYMVLRKIQYTPSFEE